MGVRGRGDFNAWLVAFVGTARASLGRAARESIVIIWTDVRSERIRQVAVWQTLAEVQGVHGGGREYEYRKSKVNNGGTIMKDGWR